VTDNQHIDEMRDADIDKELAEWRSTLTTSVEVLIGFQPRPAFHAGYQAATTRYQDALREAREALDTALCCMSSSYAEKLANNSLATINKLLAGQNG